MSMNAFSNLIELQEGLNSKQFTAVDLVSYYFERIETFNDKLHAFVRLDHERAFSAARASDNRRAAGDCLGPLDGIPIAVKDMFDIDGQIRTCGSKQWREEPAKQSALVIERLEAAGMCILGATHMVEFAFGAWGTNPTMGTPWNPWDLTVHRIPGGSSSGSAVAVAAGMTPAAIGSDTGGSVRTPAALNGITGLKTTKGLISLRGALPLSNTLDTIGPLCRTAADCALLTSVMAEVESGIRAGRGNILYKKGETLDLVGQRIAVMREEDFPVHVAPDIVNAFRKIRDLLIELGAQLLERPFPFDLEAIVRDTGTIISVESWQVHGDYIESPNAKFGLPVKERIIAGNSIPERTYKEALIRHNSHRERWTRWMDGLSALLMPALPMVACPLAQVDENATPLSSFARMANFVDACALTFPAGIDAAGLPIGLQLVGKPFDEVAIARIGHAIQQKSHFHLATPNLPPIDG